MTLAVWCEHFGGQLFRHPETGCAFVLAQEQDARRALFSLADYLVSSVSGQVYYLQPKKG